MRKTSIISIIRKYGLNSKKLDDKYRIKYSEALNNLSNYHTNNLKLINVVDNYNNPEESISKVCMVNGCGKHIRYENHVLDLKTKKIIVCGSNCCCTLLGLSELQIKNFKNIEEALKEKAELEQWKKDNPDVVSKLDSLNKYKLPFYKPFIEEINTSALNKEDTAFIKSINMKLVLSDLKYVDALDDLIKYDAKNIYKSIRDHFLVEGKYLSNKQKQFIEKEYDLFQQNKEKTTIEIANAYDYRDILKEKGYTFNHQNKKWSITLHNSNVDKEISELLKIKIQDSNIERKKAKW